MAEPSSWKSVIDNFTRNAAHFNRVGPPFYSTFAERLLDIASLPAGAEVLDVCCGTGAVTFPVARRVGARGHVLGVDITLAMLERAREDARALGITNVEFRRGDATQLDVTAAGFDAVTCGFGIQFLPDPGAGVVHWASVLKPGGQLACSTWANGGFEPLMGVARELLAQEGVTQDGYHGRVTSDPNNLVTYAKAAGLREVECHQESSVIHFTNAADVVLGTPRGRNVLNVLPEARRETVRSELIRRLDDLAGRPGIDVTMEVLYLVARKAS